MMTKLLQNLEPVVNAELKEANKNYPAFSSSHEGAAVILEEVEEAESAMKMMERRWDELWHDIKADNRHFYLEDIDHLRESALYLAAEAVQVAAMCDKWRLGRREEYNE